jgi:predicted PurR-regulated permease PerM
MKQSSLIRFNLIIFSFFLVFAGMYFAREFLIPLALAMLFAMLLTPFCRWMESKGLAKGLAATLCSLTLLIIFGALITFIGYQVSGFSNEMPQLKSKAEKHYRRIKDFTEENLGITIVAGSDSSKQQSDNSQQNGSGQQQESQQNGQEQQDNASQNGTVEIGGDGASIRSAFTYAFSFLKLLFGSVFTIGLILAYIVLLLYYRRRFKRAIVMAFPIEQREKTQTILHESGKVAQRFLGGMFIVTTILAVINSTGLLIIGVEHAILFGVLAGYLNFIPFIGSLIGSTLPIALTLLTRDSFMPALAIGAFFIFSQFIEETILTPKFVGSQVRVNPLFIIFSIVIGNMIWGIAGIVIFIPLTAVLKIIFDHIQPLKPIGYAIGQEEEEDDDASWFKKLKDWVGSKVKRAK